MSEAPQTVFILEDDPERVAQMLNVIEEILPRFFVHVEDDAQLAIAWLREHQAELGLISLDHDLDSVDRGESPTVDHGCGRDVTKYLCEQTPTCPVIVHTSNATAGSDMIVELKRTHWPSVRVYPFESYEWITRGWKEAIKEMIARGWITAG